MYLWRAPAVARPARKARTGLKTQRGRNRPTADSGWHTVGRTALAAGGRQDLGVSPEEFSDFYAASFRRLVGQLYVMTGDHPEAQDAVQEAFVRAWAHRTKLDSRGSPEAWVRATAWNIAVSRWHRARAGRRLLRGQPPPVVDEPGPDHVVLIEALRRLPAEQRRAIVLYHLCDLTVAEIAAETGAPSGTVKARLVRGRAALVPFLRQTAETESGGR
jgi:RNA polymerase sigma-70 factor, ECF subfamily